jgi:CarD family transcriptional regulator
MLDIGNKVVYPGQGPCFICALVSRVVDNTPMTFFHLIVLNGSGDMFIPVDKIESIGIRPMLNTSDIPRLLDQLKEPTSVPDDFRQRARDNAKRFMSGSAFALAEVVESLTELSKKKGLGFGEIRTLERARSMLICEISEVMRKTKEEAEKQMDEALNARNEVAFNFVDEIHAPNTRERRQIFRREDRKVKQAVAQST